MLDEPEASMVAAWLAAGHVPQRIPFGISGTVWRFAQTARQSGAWGAFKRYGGKHVPRECFPMIAVGELTVAEARVETAWQILQAQGPMSANRLSQAMQIDCDGGQNVLRALVLIGRVEILKDARYERARATGVRPPHWTDFAPAAPQRAA